MRKGEIFMPIFTIGLLILMSTFIFFIYSHQKGTQEFFSIGLIQSNIIKDYFESEKIFFYYEKLLEYNEYKAIKEFSEDGAVMKSCKKRWKFNSECEPKFENYFKELLIKKLENKYEELKVNQEVKVYFTDFIFSPKSNTTEVNYGGKVIIKKQPLINFNELSGLKTKIKDCIQSKDINKCSPESNTDSIYKFKHKIAEILNEKLEKEEVYLEFEVDTKDSGLVTSIF